MAAQLPGWRGGVARGRVARGGVWLVGSYRDRDGSAIGPWCVRSGVRLIRNFSIFLFLLLFLFSSSRWDSVGTQAFSGLSSFRSMSPVKQRGKSFSVLCCGLVSG